MVRGRDFLCSPPKAGPPLADKPFFNWWHCQIGQIIENVMGFAFYFPARYIKVSIRSFPHWRLSCWQIAKWLSVSITGLRSQRPMRLFASTMNLMAAWRRFCWTAMCFFPVQNAHSSFYLISFQKPLSEKSPNSRHGPAMSGPFHILMTHDISNCYYHGSCGFSYKFSDILLFWFQIFSPFRQ